MIFWFYKLISVLLIKFIYFLARPNLNMSNVKDINVKAGQNFQIQVPFSGFPKPTAVWMNGIKEIEDDTRINLKVAEDHVLLTNTKAERGDAGRYRLTLKNPSGQDSGSLNVNVLGKLNLRNSFLLQFITVKKKKIACPLIVVITFYID